MSLSINKLLRPNEVVAGNNFGADIQPSKNMRPNSNDKLGVELRPADIPARYNNLTASQYYASVRGVKSGQNITMPETPDGRPDMPHGRNRQDPQGFTEDGWIDPLNRRERKDPLGAPAPDYYEGQEGVLYGLPKSTMESHNNVELLQKARASYLSRINMFNAPPQQQASPTDLMARGGT